MQFPIGSVSLQIDKWQIYLSRLDINIKIGSPIIYLSFYQEYEKFGSCRYKVWKIPPLAICRRGSQKCLCWDSSLSPNLRTRGVQDINPSPRAGGKIDVPAETGRQETERPEYLLPLPFYSLQAFNRPVDACPDWGVGAGAICFPRTRDSNTNLIQKGLRRHTRACLTRGPVRLTHKIDHGSK